MEPKLRLMIVDDELIVRESLSYWFKKYGHEIDTAASGAEALEKLEQRSLFISCLWILKCRGWTALNCLKG